MAAKTDCPFDLLYNGTAFRCYHISILDSRRLAERVWNLLLEIRRCETVGRSFRSNKIVIEVEFL